MKNILKISVFIICFFQINSIFGQTKTAILNESDKIKSEIKSNENHIYSVNLEANQFAFFKLQQIDIDLLITTFDSNGNKIESFDSPNGTNGTEYFSIISNLKGTYKLEVSSLDQNAPAGKYELEIEKLKAKATTKDKQVDQLFMAWDRKDSPGATVAVVKDGKIIHKNGYGMANLEYDIPNKPSTIFHIASVSKQFTTFAILLLEKDEKLSLDDDVRKYIPEVPDFGKKLTLRQLAHHTSGLRDQWALIAMKGGRLDDVITREHILKLTSMQKELNFEPGAEYLYSNTGYTLLAEVVARVSGKSFPEFTDERIFKPLKMTNTLFFDDHEKIVKNRAYSYRPYKNGYKKVVLSYANVGATSLFTTVEDLSLWALNFENPVVGDREIFEKMKTRGVLNNGQKIGYALGQGVGKYRGLNRISHSGGDAGFRTYLGRFPDEMFTVIVFSNDGSFNAGQMAQKVVDIYLNNEIDKTEKSNPPKKPKPIASETKPNQLDEKLLKEYIGSFQLLPNFIIKITEKDGKLFAQATGQNRLGLNAISPTKFAVIGVNAEISFHRDNKQEVNLLKLHQGGNIQDAKRVKAFDPNDVDLTKYTGEFYSDELDTKYKFVFENGKLIAKHSRLDDIVTRPVNKDLFTANSWFFSQIRFVRNAQDEIKGIRVSNGRVRNLFFKKIS